MLFAITIKKFEVDLRVFWIGKKLVYSVNHLESVIIKFEEGENCTGVSDDN